MTFWHKALVAGLLLTTPTIAAPGPALESALRLQAAEMARLQAFVVACDVPAAADVAEAWNKTTAMMVATLAFNGASSDTVEAVKVSFDTPRAEPDCADERAHGAARHMAEDWVGRMTYQLEQLGFVIKADLPDAALWEMVKAEIIAQSRLQGRLLLCLSLREPLYLPGEVHRWDSEVAETAALLTAAGFGSEELLLLPRVMADNIWRPAVGDAIATLTADCDADTKWSDDMALYNFPRIVAPVEALLQP